MMATLTLAHRAIERFEIHAAVCRARQQGLRCSACCELHERAVAAYEAARLTAAA